MIHLRPSVVRTVVFVISSLLFLTINAQGQPSISSFSPTSGPVGTSVVITGSNFSATPANDIVYFGSVKATVIAATATSLTVSVPSGSTYQPISVTTSNLTAYSQQPFIVTFQGGGSFSSSTFLAKVDHAAGNNPQMISIGDLDGDGKSDIAVTNSSSGSGNTVSIFRNTTTNGAISFAAKTDLTTATGPSGITSGDIDADGKLDLVVTYFTGTSNTVSVFRNTSTSGAISFATSVDVTMANYAYEALIIDLDEDGKSDLVVKNQFGVSILRNTGTIGTISFAPKVDFATGISIRYMAIADLDTDGKPDLAVTNYGPSSNPAPAVSFYRNISTGGTISFASRQDFALPNDHGRIAAGDLDGDGKNDLSIVNSPDSKVTVIRNTSTVGAISFAPLLAFNTPVLPISASIGDLNGDGKPDVAISNGSPASVSLFKNNSAIGNITFEPKVDFATTGYSTHVALGDLNNDGEPDIVVANNSGNTISVLKNRIGEPTISSFSPASGGSGTSLTISGTNFTNISAVVIGGIPATSFAIVSPTIITAEVGNGGTGNISVTNQIGTGSLPGFTFGNSPTISSFTPTSGIIGTTVTITGTNFKSTPTDNIVYFGAMRAPVTAATSTSLVVTVPAGATYEPITVSTGNLSAHSTKPFSITFQGEGPFASTSFNKGINYTSGIAPTNSCLGDFDTDGKPDIAVVNYTSGDISVFKNNSLAGTISLAAKVDFLSGTGPYDVVASDLDADGKLDLLAANFNSGTISIFRNTTTNGIISFDPKVDFSPGPVGPIAITIADFDGDGKLDFATANAFNSVHISVFRNASAGPGNIDFSPHADFEVGTKPYDLFTADYDGDGKPDLAVANYESQSVCVLRNTSSSGMVSFASKVDLAVGTSAQSITSSDFDADGKTDLAVLTYIVGTGNRVSLFRNTGTNGAISFGSRQELTTIFSSSTISTTDLDGDGKQDLALANHLIRNTSSIGALTFDTPISLGTSYKSITVGDLDCDSKPDLISCTTTNEIHVLRNRMLEPNITSFTPTRGATGTTVTITGTNFTGATAVNFGGLAASSFTIVSSTTITAILGAGSTGNLSISVTTDKGTGTTGGFSYYDGPAILAFSPATGTVGSTITIVGERFSPTPANNIVRFGATQAEILSATNSQLVIKVPAGSTHQPITVTTGSLTAYSAKSFIVTYPGGGVISNSSFAPKSDFSTGTGNLPEDVMIGDLDGDGNPDIIAVNTSNIVSIFRNTGAGTTFSADTKIELNAGNTPTAISIADFDGDGKLDVAVANSATSTVSIFRNTSVPGIISFQAKLDFSTDTNPQSISTGDLDGDGKPDIATANFTGSKKVSILRNISIGTTISFAPKIDIISGGFPAAVSIHSLDTDEKPELIVANSTDNNISVFKNTSSAGTISFAAPTNYSTGNFPLSIAVGELNGDDHPDIVVANSSSSSVSVFKSSGPGTFFPKSDLTTGNSPNKVALGDLNGDGKLDIATANSTASSVSVLRSVGISFVSKVDLTVGAEPGSVAVGDLDRDGIPDVISANFNSSAISVLKNLLPSITSFTPTSAGAGTTVTITGVNLSGVSNVKFGATSASAFTEVSASSITAVVGLGSSGTVSVTVPGGSISLSGFTFIPAPTITSFTPTTAPEGAMVTITGTNFTNASSVTFGATPAISFTVISATSISAVVGPGSSGAVSVTTPGGSATLAGFSFLPPPTITSFSPTSGGPKTVVVISGTNFTNASSVTFGDVPAASFTVISVNRIEAIVGNAASGNVSLTTPNGTGSLTGFIYDGTIVSTEIGNHENLFEIFPNPNSGHQLNLQLHSSLEGKLARVDLSDMTGSTIASSTIVCKPTTTMEIKSEPLKRGFYIVTIYVGDKKMMSKIVVRE